jgi:hypothetical protein
MTGLASLASALLFAANPATADPPAQVHQQHQAIGQHQATTPSEARCCCDETMHKMMMQMMQMHQGMGMSRPKDGEKPPQQPEQHQH